MCRALTDGGRRCPKNLHDAARADAARATRRAQASLERDDLTPRARTFATQTLTRARHAENGGTAQDAVNLTVAHLTGPDGNDQFIRMTGGGHPDVFLDGYTREHLPAHTRSLPKQERHATVYQHAISEYAENFAQINYAGADYFADDEDDSVVGASMVLDLYSVRTKIESARTVGAYLATQPGSPYTRDTGTDTASYLTGQWAAGLSYHQHGAPALNQELQAAAARFTNNGYHLPENPDPYDRYVAAQYEATQRFLARHGITHVDAHRGYAWGTDDETGSVSMPPEWAKNVPGTGLDRVIEQNPVASWSTSRTVASYFAGDRNDYELVPGAVYGVVAHARVPASRVLSFPNTGMGSLHEQEVTILAPPRGQDSPVHLTMVGNLDQLTHIFKDKQSMPSRGR